MKNKRVCVLGDKTYILGFKALGFETFFVTKNTAEDTLKKLISEKYPIIFITENYAKQLYDILEDYTSGSAVIPIPCGANVTGYGQSRIKKAVEIAVGSDIIFNE